MKQFLGERIIAISTTVYDGYNFPHILDSLASLGVPYVEPAFIAGYTEPLLESAFSQNNARQHRQWLDGSLVGCHSFSGHMDLGLSSSVDSFRRRMDFARTLGARIINTYAADLRKAEAFSHNIEQLARHAEKIDMVICLENPGDSSDNLFNVAAEGIALITRLGLEHVRLNFDPGNLVSHRPGTIDVVQDAIEAMPLCEQVHIKDVRSTAEGWTFPPIGDGDIRYSAMFSAMVDFPKLALTIEVPMRLCRDRSGYPHRSPTLPPIAQIESTVRRSLAYVTASRRRAGTPHHLSRYQGGRPVDAKGSAGCY